MPTFGDAEQILLEEARQRFDFEQKSTGSLHSKSALFLTLTSIFAAFITSLIGRLLDHPTGSVTEIATLSVFVICLGILVFVALLLGRSVLSRSYQVIANPGLWVKHLALLRGSPVLTKTESEVLTQLRWDLLDAWTEAIEVCSEVNRTKAAMLERVSKMLSVAIPTAFLGMLLLVLQLMLR